MTTTSTQATRIYFNLKLARPFVFPILEAFDQASYLRSCLGRIVAVSSGRGRGVVEEGWMMPTRVQPVPESSDSSLLYLAPSTTGPFPSSNQNKNRRFSATMQPWMRKWKVVATRFVTACLSYQSCTLPDSMGTAEFILQRINREDVWNSRPLNASSVTYN